MWGMLRLTHGHRQKLVREETWGSMGLHGCGRIHRRHRVSYRGTVTHPDGWVCDTDKQKNTPSDSDDISFPWTMRILGFILLGLLTVANLTMRRRLPPKNIAGGILNIKSFRSPAFTVYCLAVFVGFLGIYSRKPKSNAVSQLKMTSNHNLSHSIHLHCHQRGIRWRFFQFCVLFGQYRERWIGNWTYDYRVDCWKNWYVSFHLTFRAQSVLNIAFLHKGTVNNMVPMIVAAALLSYAWPHAKTQGTFIAIATLYG